MHAGGRRAALHETLPTRACTAACRRLGFRRVAAVPGPDRAFVAAIAVDSPVPARAGRSGVGFRACSTPRSRLEVTIEPLDDHLVIQPLDESETASGLIVPINEAAQCATGIVVSVGPDVASLEPGDKVLYPRDAGYEVRLVALEPPRAGGSARGPDRADPRLSAGRYPSERPERCPSGLRSATGNRVRAERCVEGSNPSLSAEIVEANVVGRDVKRPSTSHQCPARHRCAVARLSGPGAIVPARCAPRLALRSG